MHETSQNNLVKLISKLGIDYVSPHISSELQIGDHFPRDPICLPSPQLPLTHSQVL